MLVQCVLRDVNLFICLFSVRGKKLFTKLPCGYPIANLTSGTVSTTPPNILKSGPKTTVSTSLTTSSSSSSVTKSIVCNGVLSTSPKQPPSCMFQSVVPKSIIKTVSSTTNAKIVPGNNHTTNLLTISKTPVPGNVIVSNSSSYSLPKSSTVVTWNSTSVIPTASVSPQKNLIASNKLPSNLKLMTHAKTKTPLNSNSRFAETIEKTTFLKSESIEDTTVKKSTLKVDSLLATAAEYSSNNFHSNTSSATQCTSALGNYNRSNMMQPRTTKVSHYAIAPTYIHPAKSLHSDSISNDIYFRQVKRKLSNECNDALSSAKRNVSSDHSSKSIQGKTWSEMESDLVRLSQEAPRKIKEECVSPKSGKSADSLMKGKEWCSYSNSQTSHVTLHVTQAKNVSPASRPSIDAISKTIANRSQNMPRSIEPPIFDTDSLCRKSLPVATKDHLHACQQPTSNQNKYVLSKKQLSPQLLTFQQSAVLPSYTKSIMHPVSRKSSQLSIKGSSKNAKMDTTHHDYHLPQHPASR